MLLHLRVASIGHLFALGSYKSEGIRLLLLLLRLGRQGQRLGEMLLNLLVVVLFALVRLVLDSLVLGFVGGEVVYLHLHIRIGLESLHFIT